MDLNTAVQRLFTPAAPPGRVGAEVELIPVTDAARPRPVDPAVLARGFDPAFRTAAVPTFEPGGQLELSPPRGGYLEVRYLDAQPRWRIGEAVATVAALLYDPQARRDALDLLLPRAGDQQRAWTEAVCGFSPETETLLSIARAARSVSDPALSSAGVR